MEIVRPTVQEWCIPVQYTSSPEIIKNCLQEVLNGGILNPQASTSDNEEATRKSQKEKIIKAHYCKMLGIAKKGNHGARRIALTKIADNPNINLKDAMPWAGHRDVKTFIDHYCYSRYSDEQKRNELVKTLNL